MKKSYGLILVLAISVTIFTSAHLPCLAAEKEPTIQGEDRQGDERKLFELTDEAIERVMNRLAESNPEHARQLEKLRESSPEKFKNQLRAIMHKQFNRNFREQRARDSKMPPGKAPLDEDRRQMRAKGPGGIRRPENAGEMHREQQRKSRGGYWPWRHEQYFVDWLGENYPDEAERLAELKEEKPELYKRHLMLSFKKFGRIMEASEENPELAEVLKEDLQLKNERNRLLRILGSAENDAKKEELTNQLRTVISSRFDLIIRRKKIAFEQLRKELEELKAQVKQGEADIERFTKNRDQKVQERIRTLLNRPSSFSWD